MPISTWNEEGNFCFKGRAWVEKKRWQRCTQWWAISIFFAGASSVGIIVRKAAAGVFLLCGNHPVLCTQTEAHRWGCWRASSARCFLIWCLELPYFICFWKSVGQNTARLTLFGELEGQEWGWRSVGAALKCWKRWHCVWVGLCAVCDAFSFQGSLSEAELWVLRGRCLSPKYKCLIRPDTAEAFPWHLCHRLSNPQEHTGWWEAPQTMSETA